MYKNAPRIETKFTLKYCKEYYIEILIEFSFEKKKVSTQPYLLYSDENLYIYIFSVHI